MPKTFALLRTNPALTTNVKLVVDTSQKLYLESYRANKAISDVKFKHVEVREEDYLFDKIPNFFKDISSELAYTPRSNNDEKIMYDDFSLQYDDLYFSGAYYAEDTFYSEEYEYTFPLHINPSYIPNSFMIFRVDGTGINETNSPNNFRNDILNNLKIVKNFDLTDNSVLGRFIINNFKHPNFPLTPTEINLNDLELSKFNGIDYEKTGFVSKSVSFDNIKKQNQRMFEFEEDLSNYWKNLNVIYPNIINLKFLFDDTPATPTNLRTWSINRYTGFYIDEIEKEKNISPYKPFQLKKVANSDIEALSINDVFELPFLYKNYFVNDINGIRRSFDPIFGDFKENINYFVEYNSIYYKVERVVNTGDEGILGDYLYKVVSDIEIKNIAPSDISDTLLIAQYEKVLLQDLNLLKNQIKIDNELQFNNTIVYNVIQNVNSNFTSYSRIYEQIVVNSNLIWGFRLQLNVESNPFTIDNFNEADLHYISINNIRHIVNKYDDEIPNIGGLYYIQSDYAISVDSRNSQSWINNGNISKDIRYYNNTEIESVANDSSPIDYQIYRCALTDIKDFDFDRVYTDYAKLEYDKNDSLLETLEYKLYLPERRALNFNIENPNIIQSSNFSIENLKQYLLSDFNCYVEYLNQYTSLIVYNTNTLYFNSFEHYISFKLHNIINNLAYTINGIQKQQSLNDYKKILPLYIHPTRIPILDVNGIQISENGLLAWKKDKDGNYLYTHTSSLKDNAIQVNRKYYREENYLLLQDETTTPIKYIDFKSNSDSNIITSLTFNDIYPMATSMSWSPYTKSVIDPNVDLDVNYIPCTSEYVASEELFEIRNVNGKSNISTIWNKNQYVCKWVYEDSLASHDQPYRLNFDLYVAGLYNNEPHTFNDLPFAYRNAKDLDYFYRFGLNEELQSYDELTLHLKEDYFDIDKYINGDFNYFNWIFKSDQLTSHGIELTKKYSVFGNSTSDSEARTLYKGIKWSLFKINKTFFDEEELLNNQLIIEGYEKAVNINWNDYQFSIVFGRKLSSFSNNAGFNNGHFGIDVYLNERYHNVVIFIYFEVDTTITYIKNNANVNIELAQIDDLYDSDAISNEDISATLWENGKIKIDGSTQIADFRIRDLKLENILAILTDYNYNPTESTFRRPTNWIHIYEDGSHQIYDNTNTDFLIEANLPDSFLIKEKTYQVKTLHEGNLKINNSLKNTIIEPNSNLSIGSLTDEGALIYSIPSLNIWNGLPLGRMFEDSSEDNRELYNLDKEIDPIMYRFSGPYIPLFKDIPLFRPSNYWTTVNDSPILSDKNWKFYDDFSDDDDNGPVLQKFGYINEIIYSKVNRNGNILKLSSQNNEDLQSIYPMVDEFGYNFGPRYIFQSNWDDNFYIESREICPDINENNTLAGKTIYLDGELDRLIINDNEKFNRLYDDFDSIELDINTLVIPLSNQTEIHIGSTTVISEYLDDSKPLYFNLIETSTKQIHGVCSVIPTGGSPTINIPIGGIVTNITFLPSINDFTKIIIESDTILEYIPVKDDNDSSNTNGNNYILNSSVDGNETLNASRYITIRPLLSQYRFTIIGYTDGSIYINQNLNTLFNNNIRSNYDTVTLINALNIQLGSSYTASVVYGDIEYLTIQIEASNPGSEYNFTIQNAYNTNENYSLATIVPIGVDIIQYSKSFMLNVVEDNKAISDITIEFWMKSEGFKKPSETILYKGTSDLSDGNASVDYSWIVRRVENTSKIEFVTQSYENVVNLVDITPFDVNSQTGNAILTHSLVSNSNINDGEWHHISLVFNSTLRRKEMYIDGILDAQNVNNQFNNIVIDDNSEKNWGIYVGGGLENGVRNFIGYIDELRIFNYARSMAEVESNWNLKLNPNSFLIPSKNIVGYWQFDVENNIEIVDKSYTISDFERVEIITQKTLNTNSIIEVENSISYKGYIVDVFSSSNMIIDNQIIEFVVSNAELLGVSDERYQIPLPAPTKKKKLIKLPKKEVSGSDFIKVSDVSLNSVDSVLVKKPSNDSVKGINIPNILRKKAVILKNKFENNVLKRVSNPNKLKLLNKLEEFNRKNILYSDRNTTNDQIKIEERKTIFKEKPIEYLNNQTVINNNANTKRIIFNRNTNNRIEEQSKLFFNPFSLNRRS